MSLPDTTPDIPRADTSVWTEFRGYLEESVSQGDTNAHVLAVFDEYREYMRRPVTNYFARMLDPDAPLLPVYSCSYCGLHTMHQDWCTIPTEPRL